MAGGSRGRAEPRLRLIRRPCGRHRSRRTNRGSMGRGEKWGLVKLMLLQRKHAQAVAWGRANEAFGDV